MGRPSGQKDTVSMEIPLELVTYFQNYYKKPTGKGAVIEALEHAQKLDLKRLESVLIARSESFNTDPITQYQLCYFSGKRDWRSVVGELISDYLAPFFMERNQENSNESDI